MRQEETGYSVLVYTRRPVPGEYPAGLAQSVHLACSEDGVRFRPLNENYGVVFASGSVRADDTIRPRGVSVLTRSAVQTSTAVERTKRI